VTQSDGAPADTRWSRCAAPAILAATGALIGLTLAGRLAGSAPGSLLALDLAVGVLSWLASPLLLWRPVGAALGLSLLAVLSPLATPPASFAALHVARWRRLPTAVAVAAVGVAAQAVQGWWRPGHGIGYPWWLALITLGYTALVGWGTVARTRAALIASLRDRARRAEAEQARRVTEARLLERRRIAREMHDVLAHRLSLLATYAGAVEYRPDAAPEQLALAAGVVRAGAHQALEELRAVIGVLREEDDPVDRPDDAPQPTLADLDQLIGESRAAGTQVRVCDEVTDPDRVPEAIGRAGYRVVQEALTNARRHAAGQPVTVRVHGGPGDRLCIEVSNPLAVAVGSGPGGTGLVGLTERVRLAGGQLEHGPDTEGFRLSAWLPWPR
jgi:signal transduction histidine kinase